MGVIAAAVDSEEKTLEVAERLGLGFPVAHGVRRDQAELLDSWWDEGRDFIQPSEFVLSKSGKVLMSTYSNSPIGRMDSGEALTLVTMMNARRKG